MPINRLKPMDLQEFINANGDMTLSAAIALIQGSADYDCPKCKIAGTPAGIITLTPPGIQVPCDVCKGMLKTDIEYIKDPDNYRNYFAFLDITGPNTVLVSATIALANSLPGGTWSTNDATTATVAADTRIVTGVAIGTAIISYTVGTASKTKEISVTG